MRLPMAHRRGFTAIELLLVLGILATTASLSFPMYRQYLIRSDLEVSRQNIAQGLQRARFLAQVAMNDSAWGFSTDGLPGRGILFMGGSFAMRDAEYDEYYSIPATVAVSGLTEVTFAKITGQPSAMGTITLTALNGEQRTITVNIGETGEVGIPDDWLDICIDPFGESPQTIKAPDSLWEYYEGQGAMLGICGQTDGGEEEGGEEEGGEEEGGDPDVVIQDDTVESSDDFSCNLQVLGAAITSGGLPLPVTLQVGIGGGWIDPFGDWDHPVSANVNDGQQHSYSCTSTYSQGTLMDVRARSWTKKQWWYDGSSDTHWKVLMQQSTGTANNQYVVVLKNGDPVPDVPGMENQASIQDFVEAYINLETGTVSLQPNQALYLFELGTTDLQSSAADFQDLVLLLTLLNP
ncbi:MAG: prepilin-type N-terminal cleavage/methylation domain-containing protein [Candidatus Peribacteraceae bacterium]|nr:prepilin-type N-terminal cleavage/methylation domain-containing protein [Candidatus Peribacteraceae bacterium]